MPHHLIDILEPWEEFNVVVFRNIVWNVWSRYMTGAISQFWWEAPGFTFRRCFGALILRKNEREHRISKKLELLAEEQGPESLHEMLKKVDLVSAENIHANNIKRTIRALEYYELTGEPICTHNEREKRTDQIIISAILC